MGVGMFALVHAFILAMFGKFTGEFAAATSIAKAVAGKRARRPQEGMTNEA